MNALVLVAFPARTQSRWEYASWERGRLRAGMVLRGRLARDGPKSCHILRWGLWFRLPGRGLPEYREVHMDDPDSTPFEDPLLPTPLVRLRIEAGAPAVWCKLDYLNPSGSTKDRIARHILAKAWRRGDIGPGSTVAEASSGSTSIAFALACARLGLPFVAFIPDCATNEREWIIRAYGGQVRRVSGGMGAVMEAARATCAAEGWFLGRQFANPDNTEAHRLFTGPEILADLPEPRVDAVVSGVGTGGTLRGLHEAFAATEHPVLAFAAIPRQGDAFAANPEGCSLRFSADVPGVAEGLSEIYRTWPGEPPEEIEIGDGLCLDLTRRLWGLGFPVGPSSGLNLAAALDVARRLGPAATIVTVFPDRMERYFSHKVFDGLREPFSSVFKVSVR